MWKWGKFFYFNYLLLIISDIREGLHNDFPRTVFNEPIKGLFVSSLPFTKLFVSIQSVRWNASTDQN